MSPVAIVFAFVRAVISAIVRWCAAMLSPREKGPPTERDHVRIFLEFLEDRRVLYSPYFLEYPAHVVESVHQIAEQAGAALALLPPASLALAPIRTIRIACAAFLDRGEIRDARTAASAIPSAVLFFAVVDVQKIVAAEAAVLAGAFALDLPYEIAQITRNTRAA